MAELKELYEQDSIKKTLLITDGEVELTDANIVSEEFSIEQVLCDEKQLRFGTCNASVLKMKIYNNLSSLKNRGLTVSQTVEGSDAVQQLGTYYVASDKPTADRNYRDIVAYNSMYHILNKDVKSWYDSVEFPCTLKVFRDGFFEYVGIEQEEIVLVNDNMTVEKTIEQEEIAGKMVIEAICALNGCFGQVGFDDLFHYVFLNNYYDGESPVYENTEQFDRTYISCQYEDYMCLAVTGLQIREDENDIGAAVGDTKTNPYVLEDNFLLYGKTQEELDAVANNILGVNKEASPYRPTECVCRGNPARGLGTAITLYTTRDVVTSYILKRTLSGVQALRDSYCAKGNEYYDKNVNGANKSTLQLKRRVNRLVRTVDEMRSEVEKVETNLATNYPTTTTVNTLISQSAEAIKLEASKKYVTNEVAVKSVVVMYAQGDSATTAPTSGWSATAPTWVSGKYIWQKTVTTYANGDTATSTPTNITGAKGDTGAAGAAGQNGAAGRGVSKITEQYYLSSSSTALTGGSWSNTSPTWKSGYYIWTRSYINWDDGTTSTTTPVLANALNSANSTANTANSKANSVANNLASNYSTTTQMNSAIDVMANKIRLEIYEISEVWNTQGYTIDIYGNGFPELDAETYEGKYYLNQDNGVLFLAGEYEVQAPDGTVVGWEYTWKSVATLHRYREELSSEIASTKNSILLSVSETYETKSNANSQYSSLKSSISLNQSNINLEVSRAKGAEANLKSMIDIAAESIAMSVTNNSTTAGITISIKNSDGEKQSATGTIKMTGLVSFTDLSTNGQTSIHGGNIQTDTLFSREITATNFTLEGGKVQLGSDDTQVSSDIKSYIYLTGLSDGYVYQTGLTPTQLFSYSTRGTSVSVSSDHLKFTTTGGVINSIYPMNELAVGFNGYFNADIMYVSLGGYGYKTLKNVIENIMFFMQEMFGFNWGNVT